jgi:hypothetical protein
MKSLPAGVLGSIVLGLGAASTGKLHARTCSFESLGCLFELAKPRFEAPPIIAFSFLPLAGVLALHPHPRLALPVQPQVTEPEQLSAPTQFSARFNDQQQPFGAEPVADPTASWALIEALRPFRSNSRVDGFSHNLGDASSYVALDYSDIFETGRAPYKGGHGVSLFFRHDF